MNDASNDGPARGRRSTLECFNDEMSILERPLENDVEYYDERPPSRWRRRGLGVIAGLAVALGGGGVLLRAQHRAPALASAQHRAPALASAQPGPALASAQPRPEGAKREPGAVASPEVLAIATIPAVTPEAEAADVPDSPPPPSRVAWAKIARAGHPRHARAGKSSPRTHGRGRPAPVD